MPRINTVEKSRKPEVCSRCQTPLPVGSTYRWIKPFHGAKLVRCMTYFCRFRPTDLSTAKTARIEEAIQDACDSIVEATCLEDLTSALESVAEIAREVADEYQDASDSWAGGNGHEEFQEKSDACNEFAEELEGWYPSGESNEEEVRAQATDQGHDPDEDWEDALNQTRAEAEDVLGSFSV